MAKPSKQLYVVAKKQPRYENGVIVSYDTPLGFLHGWNPKKPDDKKHATQRDWAYNANIGGFSTEERNGELWILGHRWSAWHPNPVNRIQEAVCELADPQPQLWDNDPLSGFKIERSVSRYHTSNKLWRLLDPRGVEFEITTGCLEEIMMSANILKGGEIDAPCIWMGNKNLVVVP